MKECGIPELVGQTDPWKADDNSKLFLAEVDLDAKENARPKQDLESVENIKVMMLPLDGFCDEVQKVVAAKRCLLDETLWAFTVGMRFAKIFAPK